MTQLNSYHSCDHCKKNVKQPLRLSGEKGKTLFFCPPCFEKWFEERDKVVGEALNKFVTK